MISKRHCPRSNASDQNVSLQTIYSVCETLPVEWTILALKQQKIGQEMSNDVPICVDEKLEAKVTTDDMFASMASDTTHDHTVLNHQVCGRLVTDLNFNHHRYAVTTAVLSNAIAAKQTVSQHTPVHSKLLGTAVFDQTTGWSRLATTAW